MSRNQEALRLRLAGNTYAEIGRFLKISRQRAQQLLQPQRAIYNLIKSKAKNKCQNCSVRVSSGHVHHRQAKGMTPDAYNDIRNLIYLCIPCHMNEHSALGGRGRKLSVSLSLQALKILRALAKKLGLSQSAVLELILREKR